VDYTAAAGGDVTFFELGSLLSELRTLVLAARPLEASDVALQNEGSKTQNVSAAVSPNRISAAKAVYDAALSDLDGDVNDVLEPLVDFEDVNVGLANLGAIVAAIDARSDLFVEHMSSLSLFGMPAAGAGYVHDRKRSIHAAFRGRVLALLERAFGGERGGLLEPRGPGRHRAAPRVPEVVLRHVEGDPDHPLPERKAPVAGGRVQRPEERPLRQVRRVRRQVLVAALLQAALHHVVAGRAAEHQQVQQRVGAQPVGAMHRHAGAFAHRVQAVDDLVGVAVLRRDHPGHLRVPD
jgi:hypothetical protein